MATNSPSAIAATQSDDVPAKKTPEQLPSRVRKCPSCRIPHADHTFGLPGPQCTGPESTGERTPQHSPRRRSSTISNGALVEKGAQVDFYKKQLELLEQEEQRVLSEINNEENILLQQIEQKKREIALLKARRLQSTNSSAPAPRQQTAPNPTPQATTNAAILPSLFDDDRLPRPQVLQSGYLSENSRGHLSDPLALAVNNVNPGLSARDGNGNVGGIDSTEIFLRPSRLSNDGTRGKPLRIIDFVSRARPTEEEKILSYDRNCKLSFILNDSKPKLKNVTVEQFSIANLRIFYELLFSKKLGTMQEVREYLSYSVKILELATKYSWESVLLYDDEYRILQHTYGFSWATDNSHLHEVMLLPKWASALKGQDKLSGSSLPFGSGKTGGSRTTTVSHLPSGEEICRIFNSRKGCQRPQCKFSHACNRRVGSQACGDRQHAGCNHPSRGDNSKDGDE